MVSLPFTFTARSSGQVPVDYWAIYAPTNYITFSYTHDHSSSVLHIYQVGELCSPIWAE